MTKLALAVLLLFSALAIPVTALEEDKSKPIRISADKALRNEKEGFTVYSGNVEMEQGSLKINAKKITIYRIAEEADRIVAKGKPAHLQQQPEPGKGVVQAQAGIIEYYKGEARILLKKDACIEQDGSKVAGETIDYYIDEQLVKAGSNRKNVDSRVEVIIPAENVQTSEDGCGTTDRE
ncbi:MAG: lipopolysaccharide transport periplasmic protein LptA [Halioglobus sp.]